MMPLITRIGGIFMLFLLHKYIPLGGGVISLTKDTAKNRRVVMAEIRQGRQTPTQSVVIPYSETKGQRQQIYTHRLAMSFWNGSS